MGPTLPQRHDCTGQQGATPMQFGSAIKGVISLIIFFYAVLTKSSRKYYTFHKRKIEIQENAFFPSANELALRPRWGLVQL